ncbi:hypothetical protein I6N95_07400 [Vagococcus sp. BWB3-3]|uniref:Ethanolamine utilization protein n=1 Tax=Vagococcus allomyrinae TaxID=2794353 RepID=A0A940SV84_9ENTE|nr:hypothetical protein [Vagococcus allomyrinae]MBP1040826.1 hypothetical protein [Vagococcus allomyrinae]
MPDFEQLVAFVTEKVMEKLAYEKEQRPLCVLGATTKTLVKRLTDEGYQLVNHPSSDSSLCIAELSLGRLGRIAAMTPKDAEEELILAHLLTKKEVLVNTSGRTYASALGDCPYNMKKKISHLEEEWQRFGAIFMTNPVIKKENRLLSVHHLQEALKDGQRTITVSKETIITPLAKDLIREYQLILIKE